MAGPATMIAVDNSPRAMNAWQLLKTPGGLQTAVTAAKLSQNLRDVTFAEDDVEFADVSPFSEIVVQVWGVGSSNHAPVIDVYGWNEWGPGKHIGTVTTSMGNFTSAVWNDNQAAKGFHTSPPVHGSIQRAFNRNTAYRGCDTYTITADYEQEGFTDTATTPITTPFHKTLSTPMSLEGDFPASFVIDLRRSRHRHIGLLVTNLGSATSAGAIFKAVGYNEWPSQM